MADVFSQLVGNGFTLVVAVAILGACLFALMWGQGPEKAVACAYLAAWGVSLLVYDRDGHQQPALAALDAVVFLGLGWLALTSKRAWLLWATAAQLLVLAAHGAMAMGLNVSLAAYVSVLGIWSLILAIALFVGALQYPAGRGKLSWT